MSHVALFVLKDVVSEYTDVGATAVVAVVAKAVHVAALVFTDVVLAITVDRPGEAVELTIFEFAFLNFIILK